MTDEAKDDVLRDVPLPLTATPRPPCLCDVRSSTTQDNFVCITSMLVDRTDDSPLLAHNPSLLPYSR